MKKEILETKNYNQFKKLIGNRNVDPIRVQRIMESIRRVGYVTSPIIVNEKMEVIDGQGRLEALRIMNLPVEYIIHENIGVDECISMNIHQINWNERDYIDSYADRGFKSYILLRDLIKEYKLNLMILCMAIKRRSRFDSATLKNGELNITEEEIERAKEKLDYVMKFMPYVKKRHGSITKLLQTLIMCYDFEDVDNDRLFKQVTEFMALMTPYNSMSECFVSVEEVYNRNARKRVYIYTEYRRFLDEINAGFTERLFKLENGGNDEK